ncbi:MAG: response regulator [Chloroflexi bacterium]|nr:MAG: response regulator [Chloroflexota bacterium]
MKQSVLIVDDEPMTLNLLRLMLEPVGFAVTGVEGGMEALEKVNENRPDVMILDVMMPDMDGLTVCKTLRNLPETADMPIVMLSGKTHLNAEAEGLAAGADKYLFKPMSRTDLINSLRSVLKDQN